MDLHTPLFKINYRGHNVITFGIKKEIIDESKGFLSSLAIDAPLHDIERDINEWLLENPYINVVDIKLSASTIDNILRAIPNEVSS
jgi:hypothetical protein